MTSHPPNVSLSRYESVIDDLPDEVLEYILSLVPPYKDLHNCSMVCKRWQRSVKNVIRHTQKTLVRAISDFNIMWKDVSPLEMTPTITKRYSHSACRYGNSMYVFGGCTSTSTTFNDLWRLDLNKREWERPLTMGTYPSPKACASIVCYKDALVLFGGWTHPSPYPLHQSWRLFNELHMYSIISKRWTSINTTTLPPAMAGHSSTIHGENMVVFGGLQKTTYMGQYGSSNDVWIFNLENHVWSKQATNDCKPQPRYGQSQIALDESHILILGGCGGPNMVFSDVWLLSMTDPVWSWREVTVLNSQYAPTHMWCHPACKIGQHVVVFSRNPVSNAPALPFKPQWSVRPQGLPNRDDEPLCLVKRTSPAERQRGDRDPNVNGRRGVLGPRPLMSSGMVSTSSSSGDESEPESAGHTVNRRVSSQSSRSPESPCVQPANTLSPRPSSPSSSNASPTSLPGTSTSPSSSKLFINVTYNDMDTTNPSSSSGIGSMAAFRDFTPVVRANCNRNRQRQLESIRKMEERLKTLSRSANTSGNGCASPNGTASSSSSLSSNSASTSSGNNSCNSGSSSNNSNSESPIRTEPTSPMPRSYNAQSSPQLSPAHKTHINKNAMTMFVLNISNVLSENCFVEWLPMKSDHIPAGGPEEMILYSLIAGKGELIMFGGIQKDATSITAQAQICSNVASTVCNSLYFISAPKGII